MTPQENGRVTSELWVVAEHSGDAVDRVTFELLGEARRLAKEAGGQVCAVALGDHVTPLVESLAHYGADTVYVVEDERLRYYDPNLVVATVGHLCSIRHPALVLFAATTTGSDTAIRLALERQWPFAPGCVNFHWNDGDIEMVRPMAGQKLHAIIGAARPGPRVASVVPDVLGFDAPDKKRSARVVSAEVVVPERSRVDVGEFIPGDPRTLDIAHADIVVAAGRGMGSKENMQLVEDLAAVLGGSVGGTRVVVDLGWLPRERQVGQTGAVVKPKLYVACGISGATQHTIGMRDAATIIAINTDAGAPIFKIADLALQADVTEVLPVLTRQCRQAGGR